MPHDPDAALGAGERSPERRRQLRAVEILSIGSELTVGDTRDTNAGDLARDLSRLGVLVGRLTALPDRLDVVRDAFSDGLRRADLVISTGGLGPTPDDLTREAIAAGLGRMPAVDPELERWLRDLWIRRSMPFPTMNLKQAWLIPGATPIPNPNGTAPGWWVDAPDGQVIIALPGPPREMRPMWRDWALPRLKERGLGHDHVARTYRLTGIGESALADLLGEAILRRANPEVATYARVEAVDVRISAHGEGAHDDQPARSAEELVSGAEAEVLPLLAGHIWGHDDDTWAGAIGRRLAARGWTLSTVEVGTSGSVVGLLGDPEWLSFAEVVSTAALPTVLRASPHATGTPGDRVRHLAEAVRRAGGSDVGLAVEANEAGMDMTVEIAVVTPEGTFAEQRAIFMGGSQGRFRAALAGAAVLWGALPAERP